MMTDDQLLARAVEAIRQYEGRREADDPFRALRVDSLHDRWVEGSTVFSVGAHPNARIEMTVDRETGEIVTSTFSMPPPGATPTI